MKKRLTMSDKALLAMREAVKKVIERHKKLKQPLAVWDDKANKVKFISPQAALGKFNKAVRSRD